MDTMSQDTAPRRFSVRPARECGVLVADLPNGGPYRRPPPTIRGPVLHWLTEMLERHASEEVHPPPAQVVILDNATVRGPGLITLPGDILVKESLINVASTETICGLRPVENGEAYLPEPAFSEATSRAGATFVLFKQLWDHNYGHWLIEGLPRVALLRNLLDVRSQRFLVSPQAPAMRRVVRDSLAVFGVPDRQLVTAGWDPTLVPQLIYPLPMTVQPWVKAPLAITVLEEFSQRMLAEATGRGPDRPAKLIIRRGATSRRRLLNEDAILDIAVRRGYSVVDPGSMSLPEQAASFSGARLVIGTLGAECTNIVFSPRGFRFLGLAPSHMQDDFFYDLCAHKDARYFSVHGMVEEPELGMNSPFQVDPALFLETLVEFEKA